MIYETKITCPPPKKGGGGGRCHGANKYEVIFHFTLIHSLKFHVSFQLHAAAFYRLMFH